MAARVSVDAPRRARSVAPTISAVGSLQRRLTVAYCTFTSATLAVLLFGMMAVGFVAQRHTSGLYRIAYSTELAQHSAQVTRLHIGLADGTLHARALDAWLREMVGRRAVFTTEAYAEFVAPDGLVLGRSAALRPDWVTDWVPDATPENMVFNSNGDTGMAAHVIARQEMEAHTEIRSPDGALVGHLKTRYRVHNMDLLYWLAGVLLWLGVVAITLGLGSAFGRWAARPLADRLTVIAQTSEQWAQGDFRQYLSDPGNDEISRLSSRLNTMAAQLSTVLAQRHALSTTEERQRIARELHDNVKQQVFAISMHLGAVGLAVPREAAQAHALLQAAQSMIQATHGELASLIFALQPAARQARGLAHGLAELVDGWRTRGTTALTLSTPGNLPAVPVDVEYTLLRVVQEALVNAIRHSAAHQVSITVGGDGDAVTLAIADDGVGFDPNECHGGLGLVSMQTRMRDIGGTLTIHSAPLQGTTIMACWRPRAT